MRKATIEMPNSCADCPCNDDEYSVCRLDKNYMSNARFVFNHEKPEWCPLDSKKNSEISIDWINKWLRKYGEPILDDGICKMIEDWEKENETN